MESMYTSTLIMNIIMIVDNMFMINSNMPNSNLKPNRDFRFIQIADGHKIGHFDPIKNTLSIENTLKTTPKRHRPIFHFLCRHPTISIKYNMSLF